jgi:hypothetical protein
MNHANNQSNPVRCPYCGGAKEPHRYACKPCWARLPKSYHDAISNARKNALQWLAQHTSSRHE